MFLSKSILKSITPNYCFYFDENAKLSLNLCLEMRPKQQPLTLHFLLETKNVPLQNISKII